jgi:catechol 2,3-dioxygenase-like lactoylglutathione lyase family enzyme
MLLLVPAVLAGVAPRTVSEPMSATVKKVTPLLHVESIEPSLPFWVDRLGYAVVSEVEHEGALGFVILQGHGTEIMMQTRASVEADSDALTGTPTGGALLFIEVEALDPVVAALEGVQVVVPRRQTSYGADEIFVREPGGNVVGFAAF